MRHLANFLAVCLTAVGLHGPWGSVAGAVEPANGVVGYWQFNNATHVGQATVGLDLIANNGAAYTASGQQQGAVTLDGDDDFLNAAGGVLAGNLPTGNTSYTISAWINTTEAGAPGSSSGIIGWGNWGSSGQVNATRLQGTTDLVNYSWGPTYDIQRNSGGTLASGTWRHVAAVYDAGTGQKSLYVDGAQIGSSMSVPALNVQSNNFAVGRTNNTEYFNGRLDEVAVSNQALSPTVIGSIAAGASAANAPLISLWRFDDPANVGLDSGALGNNLTAQGDAAYSAGGLHGGALSLDGNGDKLDAGGALPSGVPTGDRQYTIAAWFKPDQTGDRGIVGWGNYGASNQVTALRLLGSNGFRHYWWGDDQDADAGALSIDLDDGDWHHIAAIYDGSAQLLYLDGLLLASRTPVNAAHASGAANFAIGSTNFGEFFDGLLDDVAIFNVALDQAQIQTIMTGDFASFGIVPEPSTTVALLGLAGSAVLLCLGRRRGRARS